MIKKLPREISDRNPLLLLSGSQKHSKSIQFKFEVSWFKNPDFFIHVERIWSKPCRASSALDKIQQKLKLLKQYFKGWDLNLQGELRRLRKELCEELRVLENIEATSSLSCEQWLRKNWIMCENLRILEQEEVYWYSRSHENWLLQGDLNTKFFS
jgi:hypothetical protein